MYQILQNYILSYRSWQQIEIYINDAKFNKIIKPDISVVGITSEWDKASYPIYQPQNRTRNQNKHAKLKL